MEKFNHIIDCESIGFRMFLSYLKYKGWVKQVVGGIDITNPILNINNKLPYYILRVNDEVKTKALMSENIILFLLRTISFPNSFIHFCNMDNVTKDLVNLYIEYFGINKFRDEIFKFLKDDDENYNDSKKLYSAIFNEDIEFIDDERILFFIKDELLSLKDNNPFHFFVRPLHINMSKLSIKQKVELGCIRQRLINKFDKNNPINNNLLLPFFTKKVEIKKN